VRRRERQLATLCSVLLVAGVSAVVLLTGAATKRGSEARVVDHASGAVSGCFATPGACGFPDPAYGNVGPSSRCSSLRASGTIISTSSGQTIEDRDVSGQIIIQNPKVTVRDVCVTYDGHARLNSTAVQLTRSATDALIEDSDIAGANAATGSVEQAVSNFGAAGAVLDHDYISNCGECVHDEPWVVENTYVLANGMLGTGDHMEPLYVNDGTLVAQHDTLLLPPSTNPQVAVVFGNVNDGNGGRCSNHITVADSLLAGGGFSIELCAHATSVGTSTMDISADRFARCIKRPVIYDASTGGTACSGYRGGPETLADAGRDPSGYWPLGGYYGYDAGVYCPPVPGQTWTGNVWDDNGASIGCR